MPTDPLTLKQCAVTCIICIAPYSAFVKDSLILSGRSFRKHGRSYLQQQTGTCWRNTVSSNQMTRSARSFGIQISAMLLRHAITVKTAM